MEVQQRGAWRSASSVTRYDKHGRLGLQLQRLGQERRRRLELATAEFDKDYTSCGGLVSELVRRAVR